MNMNKYNESGASTIATGDSHNHAGYKNYLKHHAPEALFVIAALWCLSPWASPGLALAIGAALALTVGNPYPNIINKVSGILLKTCVVMLGFAMDLPTVVHAGASGMMFAACTIAGTLILGYISGRILKIERQTSLLISTGTAICGGSAIAAVGSVIKADKSAMTVAMGTVFLFNGAALYLFPVIGHLLGMSQFAFGTWAGIAIHDISSVVGAAASYGHGALDTATAVKLSRALWIVPVVLVVSIWQKRAAAGAPESESGENIKPKTVKVPIPWFIGFFILASVARSFVPGLAPLAPDFSNIAETGMTVALFFIGAGLSRQALQSVGWRAIAQGLILWIVISASSLLVIVR